MQESAASTQGAHALPAPRYAWYVVAVLMLANLAGFVDRQILSLLVTDIKRDLAISDTQMGVLLGVSFSVLFSLLALPIGRLADRASRRNIMGVGVALWSIMTALCGLAGSFTRLLAARVGVGIGEASLTAPATSLLTDYFPRNRLGSAMSVMSMGIFIGSGLAYVVGGAVIGALHAHPIVWPLVGAIRPWQSVFFIVGFPGLLVALLFLTIREPVRRSSHAPSSTRELLHYVRRNRRTFAGTSLGFSLSGAVNFGIAGWLATFLQRTYGWNAARAGAVMGALTMTVGVLGVFIGGLVADRYARRGRTDGPLRVGIIGALGMLVAATAYPLMPNATLAVAWLVVVNFFAAFPWGAINASAAEIVPASMRAQGAALYFFVFNLVAASLGPAAVGALTQHLFHADAALRYSLALLNLVGMSATIALLLYAMPAYRRTIATRND